MKERAVIGVSERAKREATVFGAIVECPAQIRAKDCIIQSELMRPPGNGEGDFSILSGLQAVKEKDSSELQRLCSSCKSCYFNILKDKGWFSVLKN